MQQSKRGIYHSTVWSSSLHLKLSDSIDSFPFYDIASDERLDIAYAWDQMRYQWTQGTCNKFPMVRYAPVKAHSQASNNVYIKLHLQKGLASW